MKTIPPIKHYMINMPHVVSSRAEASAGYKMMKSYKIRHLPVVEDEKLVGVVSDRDFLLASSLCNLDEKVVGDIMTPNPYAVEQMTSLDKVITEMANHRYGCAIVQHEGKVTGIFTTVDVAKTLSKLLAEITRGNSFSDVFKILNANTGTPRWIK